MRFPKRNHGILLSAAALLLVVPLPAQPAGTTTTTQNPPSVAALHLPASANDLVRRAIDNQLKQENSPRFMYRVRRETPSGVQTKEYIETADMGVSWLLAVNDQPLSAEQRKKEDSKLDNLLKNPDEQAKRRKDDKEDDERTRKMLNAMPDAFIYTYDGTELARDGVTELVRLSFNANPDFKPPDRETQVFRGMEGHMLIDPSAVHMVKIDARLVQDVNFGWGIFGHLDKGGHFMVEQAHVGPGRWDTTDMILDFTGKILLFKRLRIKEHQVSSDYRPVPQNLSLSEGVQMLRKQAPQLAQKKQF